MKRANPREIPGYYFDEEKKRYFKIPPKTDKSTYVNIPRRANKTRHTSSKVIMRQMRPPTNKLNIYKSHQYGVTNEIGYQRKVERLQWEQAPTQVPSLPNSQRHPDLIEALCLSQDGKYLIRKNVIASSYPRESNFSIYTVSIDKGVQPEFNVKKIFHFQSYHTQFAGCDWTTIDGDQWALFAFQRDGPFNSDSSTLSAFQFKQPQNSVSSEHDVRVLRRPGVMEESPWSIIANSSTCKRCGHFGIGGETRQYMYDIELKMRYSYSTNKVTVLSQGFYKQHPYLISGLRNGKALIWDLRTFPSDPAHVMQDEKKQYISPIIWLQPVINDSYIIVQKQNGELALWDSRTFKKCVVYNHPTSNSSLDLIGYRAFLSESERQLVAFPRGPDKPMAYDVVSGDVMTDKFYKSFDAVGSRFCYGRNWGGGDSNEEGILQSTDTESWRFFRI